MLEVGCMNPWIGGRGYKAIRMGPMCKYCGGGGRHDGLWLGQCVLVVLIVFVFLIWLVIGMRRVMGWVVQVLDGIK